MNLPSSPGWRTASVVALSLCLAALTARAQETITVTELPDAAQRAGSEEFLATAETGEQEVGWQAAQHGLELLLLFSPDSRFLLIGQPTDSGLDVAAYQLFLVSLLDKNLAQVSDMALGATFAPTSDYLFIATGPHPVLYNLVTRKATTLEQIDSGVENYPVWVSSWSADGKELVINQQQRFDSPAEPRSWKVRIGEEPQPSAPPPATP